MSLQAPQIDQIPEVGDSWCIVRWQTPSGFVKKYKLILFPLNKEILLDGTITTYREVGLENGKPYKVSIQATLDETQWSEAVYTSEFETGHICSSGPFAAQVTPLSSNRVHISWLPPVVLPDAPIRWYVIESQSTCSTDPIKSYTILSTAPTNTTLTIPSFQGRYRFYVYAVNCPGYSPATPTNWIFTEPVPDFSICAEFNEKNTEYFMNFKKEKLSTNTLTRFGYSYTTTFPNSVFLPIKKHMINHVSYCISVYKTGNHIGYAGIMMSRYPEKGSGICLAGNGETLAYYWNDSTTALPTDTGIPLENNQWIHLALVLEPEKVKFYKNGGKVYELNRTHTPAQITRIFFGRNPVSDSLCFPGFVSNIRFYERALLDDEILKIYTIIKN